MHYKTTPGCKPKQSKQNHQKMDWKSPGDVPLAASGYSRSFRLNFQFEPWRSLSIPSTDIFKALFSFPKEGVLWSSPACFAPILRLLHPASPCQMLLVNTAGDVEKEDCLETATNYYYL